MQKKWVLLKFSESNAMMCKAPLTRKLRKCRLFIGFLRILLCYSPFSPIWGVSLIIFSSSIPLSYALVQIFHFSLPLTFSRLPSTPVRFESLACMIRENVDNLFLSSSTRPICAWKMIKPSLKLTGQSLHNTSYNASLWWCCWCN